MSIRRSASVALLVAAVAVIPAQASQPANPGSQGKGHSHSHGNSHKCKPHKVAWVVKGILVSQSLTKNSDGTYSGDVTVNVTHTNKHARAEQNPPQPKTYTLDHAKAKFDVSDQPPPDGTVDQTDLVAGDQVKLTGKITTFAKKCDQTGFTATTTIRRVVFHNPPKP
jgi:hypothetical protein